MKAARRRLLLIEKQTIQGLTHLAGARISSRILADRYVGAIFDLAQENANALGAFESFFTALEALIEKDGAVMEAFANPTASRKSKAALAKEIAALLKAGTEQSNFLQLLATNNRLGFIPSIISAFRARYAAHKGEVVLEITTARPADKATLGSIQAAVEKETGKTTVLETKVDPSILGGIVIKLGSTLLDCSLEGQLARMEQSLKQHIANA